MSKIQPPKTPKNLHQEPQTFKRELPMWCRGIMGGCVNCGGCI
ncbi:MAG: hypothetical protein P8Y18_07920 [Candidatus Bathyarchaeota archaeon]